MTNTFVNARGQPTDMRSFSTNNTAIIAILETDEAKFCLLRLRNHVLSIHKCFNVLPSRNFKNMYHLEIHACIIIHDNCYDVQFCHAASVVANILPTASSVKERTTTPPTTS